MSLQAPPLPTMPMPEVRSASEALECIAHAAKEPGLRYLPCAWLCAVAERGLAAKSGISELLDLAESYLNLARSGDAGPLMEPGEIREADALLERYLPLPPVPEAIETLLVQACAEQMIDEAEAADLRKLARRLAK